MRVITDKASQGGSKRPRWVKASQGDPRRVKAVQSGSKRPKTCQGESMQSLGRSKQT